MCDHPQTITPIAPTSRAFVAGILPGGALAHFDPCPPAGSPRGAARQALLDLWAWIEDQGGLALRTLQAYDATEDQP